MLTLAERMVIAEVRRQRFRALLRVVQVVSLAAIASALLRALW